MFTLPTGGMRLPFDIDAAISSFATYCANGMQASIAEYLTKFLTEGGYHLVIRCAPSTLQQGNSNTILANQSYEDQLSVPIGSFLIMVGGINSIPVGDERAPNVNLGFRAAWYDAGSQQSDTDSYINGNLISGFFTQLPQTGQGMLTTVGDSKSLFVLPSPLVITSPGQLTVKLVNLSQVTTVIDMAFYFAAPNGDGELGAAALKNSVTR